MNLRHLRTFVAIAENGGFARAATRLNLTQSAASRQILALEAELDLRLFDRIRATDCAHGGRRRPAHWQSASTVGRRIARRAGARVEERTNRHSSRRRHTPRDRNPPVGISCQYRRGHPGVEIYLVEDGGARLAGRLERSEVQLAHMPAGDERFQGRLLYPMHVLALVPKAHRLARRAVIDILDLSEEPLLLLGRGFGSHQWFEAACRVAQMRPRVLLESNAPHTLVSLVSDGYGLAIMPSNAYIPRGKICAIPIVHRKSSIGRWSMMAVGSPENSSPLTLNSLSMSSRPMSDATSQAVRSSRANAPAPGAEISSLSNSSVSNAATKR